MVATRMGFSGRSCDLPFIHDESLPFIQTLDGSLKYALQREPRSNWHYIPLRAQLPTWHSILRIHSKGGLLKEIKEVRSEESKANM